MFGKVPAYMAGRERIIDEMLAAFDGNGSDPSLCSIFTGARGTGKTAMLSYLSCRAEQAGWVTASTTASPGMLDDILQCLERNAAHLLLEDSDRKLCSVEIAPLGSVSWEASVQRPENWRAQMSRILDALAPLNAGVMITVDEIVVSSRRRMSVKVPFWPARSWRRACTM